MFHDSLASLALDKPAATSELLKLAAAALRDIEGLTDEEVAEQLGLSVTSDSNARKDAAAGRRMWAALGAWPWTYFQPPRFQARPRDSWWQDETVALGWMCWASDKPLDALRQAQPKAA